MNQINPNQIQGTGVVQNPNESQAITQPTGTTFTINNFASGVLPYPVTAYGAVGDGTTDNTAAFDAMEASSETQFFLPEGNYKTTQPSLTKLYWGSGAINLDDVTAQAGTNSTVENERISDFDGVNSWTNTQQGTTTLAFIGDSITFGVGTDEDKGYFWRLQKMLNDREGGVGQGTFPTGGTLDWLVLSGTTSRANNGPVNQSLVMQPGATATITADNVRNIGLWYQRAPGAGTITISNGAGTIGTVNTAGAAANNVFVQFNMNGAPKTQTFVFTCSVAACEITGISGLATINPQTNPMILTTYAQSGYATTQFLENPNTLAYLASTINFTAQGFWSYVIALGTNNIYNPPTATSSAQYKADLLSIIASLGTSATPILTVPLRAAPGTYAPVLEPFDNYRNAVYQIAREKRIRVVDLSELDLVSVGAMQADGLHPNYVGYAIMADFWWKKLGLAGIGTSDNGSPITLLGGATNFGTPYAPAYSNIHNGQVYLSGVLAVGGVAKGTKVGQLGNTGFYPSYQKILSATSTGTQGSVELVVQVDGSIVLFDFSATTITNVSLDGLSYPISEY